MKYIGLIVQIFMVLKIVKNNVHPDQVKFFRSQKSTILHAEGNLLGEDSSLFCCFLKITLNSNILASLHPMKC